MKYYIYSVRKKAYTFIADDFDDMINYFAGFNKPKQIQVRHSQWSFLNRWKDLPIDPKAHRYQDYNTALANIAMNPNEYYTTWGYDYGTYQLKWVEKHHRDIMVFDEMMRTIDPRHYWDIIAVTKHKYKSRGKRRGRWIARYDHPYEFRNGPVPRTAKRWRGGRSQSNIRTFQERKLSVDPEMKEFVRPSRNFRNLPSSWDQGYRYYGKSWKNKKLEKQWMKHCK